LEIRNSSAKIAFPSAHGTFTFYRILINSRRYLRVAAHSACKISQPVSSARGDVLIFPAQCRFSQHAGRKSFLLNYLSAARSAVFSLSAADVNK
jgi:hypothetical protein